MDFEGSRGLFEGIAQLLARRDEKSNRGRTEGTRQLDEILPERLLSTGLDQSPLRKSAQESRGV